MSQSVDVRHLSFPDSTVEKFAFDETRRTLKISVDECIFDDDRNVKRLGQGVLTILNWESLVVSDYSSNQKLAQPEPGLYLVDLHDVHFDPQLVRIRGLGQGTNQLVDYVFTNASYEFVTTE